MLVVMVGDGGCEGIEKGFDLGSNSVESAVAASAHLHQRGMRPARPVCIASVTGP